MFLDTAAEISLKLKLLTPEAAVRGVHPGRLVLPSSRTWCDLRDLPTRGLNEFKLRVACWKIQIHRAGVWPSFVPNHTQKQEHLTPYQLPHSLGCSCPMQKA